MRKKHFLVRVRDAGRPYVSFAPACQKGGPGFMRRLKAALDEAECGRGQALPQKALGEILGVPKSTIHDWLEGPLPDPIRALLCGLERLGPPQWSNLIRSSLRDCPRLEDPRLAHNAGLSATLNTILSKPGGLTLIHGAPPSASRFVFHALGNSIRRANPKLQASGIDVEVPLDLVPVPGVCYVRQPDEGQTLRRLVGELWRLLRNSDEQVLLLNGVVKTAPELWPEIVAASSRRQVLLADNALPAPAKEARASGRKATLFTVSSEHATPGKINVMVSSLVVAG